VLWDLQLTQAETGKFNVHVHVESDWRLHNDDLDESEDEMEDKVYMLFNRVLKRSLLIQLYYL